MKNQKFTIQPEGIKNWYIVKFNPHMNDLFDKQLDHAILQYFKIELMSEKPTFEPTFRVINNDIVVPTFTVDKESFEELDENEMFDKELFLDVLAFMSQRLNPDDKVFDIEYVGDNRILSVEEIKNSKWVSEELKGYYEGAKLVFEDGLDISEDESFIAEDFDEEVHIYDFEKHQK